jgi:hypothetical protein
VPRVGGRYPVSARSIEVLPEPLAPRMAQFSAGITRQSIARMIVASRSIPSPRISITGSRSFMSVASTLRRSRPAQKGPFGAAGFRAFVARQPVVYRRRSSRSEPRRDGRGSMLAQTETAISAQLGLKHSDFLKRKHGSGDLLCLAREGAES